MDAAIGHAVQGAVVGWTLGAQCRGRSHDLSLRFYDPIPPRMAQSDAVESWLVWSQHLREGIRPELLATSLAKHWHYPNAETAFGLANIQSGFGSPLSGAFSNPLSSGSQAFGRAVYWGLAFHGEPDEAARYAYYDASIDHTKDGVWIPVAIAYAIATIKPGEPIKRFIDAFIYALPRESQLRGAIPLIIKGVAQVDGSRKLYDTLAESLGIVDIYSAPLTGAWLIAGLVQGNGTFEGSILETAAFGGASNHACLVSGATAAIIEGDVPKPWLKPLMSGFVCGHGLISIEPPKTVEQLSIIVQSDASQFGVPPPEPIVQTDENAEVNALAPFQAMVPIPINIAQSPNGFSRHSDNTLLTIHYVTSPCYIPNETLNLSIRFENTSAEQLDLMPKLSAPNGWECAHKMSEFSLLPGGGTSFPVVLRSKNKKLTDEQLSLSLNESTITIPLLAPQRWYCVGPLLNQEGTGFDAQYPAESKIEIGQVFNGRSNMPVEWREVFVSSCEIDVESLMAGGPGTAYYYSKVKFAKPGRYRLVVASGVGAIIFIDGQKRHWYHDTHIPVPYASSRYTTQFESIGETSVLIKTFRNLNTIPPMTVYFLDEDGSIIRPSAFLPI